MKKTATENLTAGTRVIDNKNGNGTGTVRGRTSCMKGYWDVVFDNGNVYSCGYSSIDYIEAEEASEVEEEAPETAPNLSAAAQKFGTLLQGRPAKVEEKAPETIRVELINTFDGYITLNVLSRSELFVMHRFQNPMGSALDHAEAYMWGRGFTLNSEWVTRDEGRTTAAVKKCN